MAEQPLSQQGRGCKRKYKLVHLSNYQLSTIEDNVPHSSWKNSLDNEQIADKNVKISQLVTTSATHPRRSQEEGLAVAMGDVDPAFQSLVDEGGDNLRGLWRVEKLELKAVPKG